MDRVGEQLPAVAITAASLTLVFLGLMFSSWESYDTQAKKAVRSKYRLRGWLSFIGIASALLSALLGFVGVATSHSPAWTDWVGAVLLAIWGILITAQGVIALRDI